MRTRRVCLCVLMKQPQSAGRREPRQREEDTQVWSHDKFEVQTGGRPSFAAPASRAGNGNKIAVENLNWEVSELNLQEMFAEVGAVQKVFIRYDRTGRSEGTAEITFATSDEAALAVAEFHGVCSRR
jgi:THO complex subunit 4